MKGRQSCPLSSYEFWWMIGFCLFAAVRVLFFSAAFPFFNNVDERRHFDLVIKYAEGHVPRGAELISPATLPYLSHYASPEFLSAPEDVEGATSDRCGSILPKKSRRRLHESKRSGVARLTRNARNRRFITLWRQPGFTSASGSASTTVARFIGFVF